MYDWIDGQIDRWMDCLSVLIYIVYILNKLDSFIKNVNFTGQLIAAGSHLVVHVS